MALQLNLMPEIAKNVNRVAETDSQVSTESKLWVPVYLDFSSQIRAESASSCTHPYQPLPENSKASASSVLG